MRTTTFLSGLGLAMVLGAGVAAAQGTDQQRPRRAEQGQMEGGRGRGGRGPEGFLLRGITLTTDQQARLADLEKQFRAEHRGQGGQGGWQRGQGQAQQGQAQRGERPKPTAEQRAAMEKERDQRAAAIRGILNADQQKQFDANLAQMKQRMEQRQKNGEGRQNRGR